jgi:hypothetical protein
MGRSHASSAVALLSLIEQVEVDWIPAANSAIFRGLS